MADTRAGPSAPCHSATCYRVYQELNPTIAPWQRFQLPVICAAAASSPALHRPPRLENTPTSFACPVQKLDLGEFETEVEASDKVNEYLRGLNSQPVDPQSPSEGALLPPYILQVHLPAACTLEARL